MCYCRHTIELKCTRSYLVMNSRLSTCSQLHQLRLYMQIFSQATLIHHFRINITIIRSRISQNRNNSTIELTLHLNNGCLMICLLIAHNYIDLRNAMKNIPNCLHLLSIIDMRPTTLVQWTILLAMIFSTCPTLQQSSNITSVLLLSRMWPLLSQLHWTSCKEPHFLSHLHSKVFLTSMPPSL